MQYSLYRCRLHRLFSKREKITRSFAKDYRRAKKNANQEGLEGIYHEERNEISIIDYEIETLTTSYYLNIARYKYIEIPSPDDKSFWSQSSLDPSLKVLSNRAVRNIRSTIREDRNNNFKLISSIITVVTGLTGAAIGLVAVIYGKLC